MAYEGKRVTGLYHLGLLARERKAVTISGRQAKRPTPAAFILQLPGQVIIQYLDRGMYIYEKKEKQNDRSRHQ